MLANGEDYDYEIHCVNISGQFTISLSDGGRESERGGQLYNFVLFRVDLIIPGLEKVGGFSICSSPGLLHRHRIIELAVKYTKHPPAHWIHTEVSMQCEITFLIISVRGVSLY